jgi:hypothetical protein
VIAAKYKVKQLPLEGECLTSVFSGTRKEYFIVGNDFPDKIDSVLLRLESMGWNLRLDRIYIYHGDKPQSYIQI